MALLIRIIFWMVLGLPAVAGLFTTDKEALKEAFTKENWDQVVVTSQGLINQKSSDAQRDLYRLILAIALHRQGKVEDSIAVLKPVTEQSLYYSWAKVFLTRLSFISGNTELMKNSLQALRKNHLKGELNVERLFYEAHLSMEEHSWNQARNTLRKIERISRGTELEIPVQESLVRVELKGGRTDALCAQLKKLYVRFPKHPWVVNHAPELKDISIEGKSVSCRIVEKDFVAHLRTLNLLGEFALVRKEIDRWIVLSAMPEKEQKLMLAQQALAEGSPEEAVKILKGAKSDDNDLQILIPLSYAAARAGDMTLAIEASMKVSALAGASKQGNKALFQAATWAYQVRDYNNAESRFRQVRLGGLSKAYRKEVQWYLGWLRYLKGDYVEAEKRFRIMQNQRSKKIKEGQDRVQYWLAMSLLKQNKLERAQVLFKKLSEKKGMNYYSFLARERLKQIPDKKIDSGGSEEYPTVTVLGRAQYFTPYGEEAPWPTAQESETREEELASSDSEETLLMEDEGAIADSQSGEDARDKEMDATPEFFSQVEANQKLERAKAFWAMGLEDLARREVGDLEKYSRGLDLFKKLAEEYKLMGLFNKVAVMGQNYAGKANMSSNKFIYEAIYPRAYVDYVEKASGENNVAQALIWGIMKAESMYRPWVRSPVGALGLMQVMPTTGQKLAEMLEVKNFTPQTLLHPQDAIRFGSKYLERLGKKFDHSVQLVAAAYNAGPHRVSQWLYYFGYMQLDEWVEHIPFLETRNYVKRVTVNYMAYNELYGRNLGDSLALIDPVPVQIAGTPETKENWD